MIYLNEKDIMKASELAQVMDAVEKAYAIDISGEYEMPPRVHVKNGVNTILYMPCFTKSIFGTKILTLFPGNAKKRKPVIDGLVLLNDPETGAPVALLDGAKLTAVRTGAVGGVAIRHITPDNANSVGLIGAGVQGFHQILFACKARNIEKVHLYDLSKNRLSDLAKKLEKSLPAVTIEVSASVEKLLSASEIVITATPSNVPVLPDDEELLRGKQYIGIGSYQPEMREFPRALYGLVDEVFIDTEHGLEESGDLITPLQNNWIGHNQIIKFGEIIGRNNSGKAGKTTLFKSVGMALFDITVSQLIYRSALKKKIGTILD